MVIYYRVGGFSRHEFHRHRETMLRYPCAVIRAIITRSWQFFVFVLYGSGRSEASREKNEERRGIVVCSRSERGELVIALC